MRCGFTDARALQVDHIHGGGGKERKGKEMSYLLRRLIETDAKVSLARYQLLCANCNVIKRIERGEHAGVRKYAKPTATAITED